MLNANLAGAPTIVIFTTSKTSILSVSETSFSPRLSLDLSDLSAIDCFSSRLIHWFTIMRLLMRIWPCFPRCAKLVFCFTRAIFLHELTLNYIELRCPALRQCSQKWGGTSSTSLSVLGQVQRNVIQLTDHHSLASATQPLIRHRPSELIPLFMGIVLVSVLRTLLQ